ncbi:30S ribosomal protein S2 [candidate division KSB1 bacterium]|nr:MAG: 30S ribosomal protein S2 [candidate division KSB1 bacterium]
MPRISLQELLEAGTHFGHLTRRWNPKMKKYIFMERNGIYVIDLKKTQQLIDEACEAVMEVVKKGEKILFVGTKKQAKEVIKHEAERCGMFYVNERWLGGTLTNFSTIKKSVKHYKNLEKMEIDGTYEQLTKKEILSIERKKEKLRRAIGGILEMNKLPGILYVVDSKKDAIAVSEANKLSIPVISIVDTNCDPDLIDYPIPGNDDAYKSISLITRAISDAVLEALETVEEEVVA